MTAHELAELLLTKPDEEVFISVYMGGNDELREVQDVAVQDDRYIGKRLVLMTYKDTDKEATK